MTHTRSTRRASARTRMAIAATSVLTLVACEDGLDFDLRGNFGNAPSTAQAAKNATAPRPKPDNRGIISYPGYQVAVARRGDTLVDLGARIGVDPGTIARYNGLQQTDRLREGEIIALPARVAEPSPATGAATTGPIQPPNVDITSLAGSAIDRAQPTAVQTSTLQSAPTATGIEPTRHKVTRGETAYTISRLYNVSVRSIAEWNGLDSNFSIREGQYLLIPPVSAKTSPGTATTNPGQGSPTPTPPSATKPLPAEKTAPLAPAATSTTAQTATAAPKPVATPDLGKNQTKSSGGQLGYPAQGKIIREYAKGRNDGIDIQAAAGAPIMAAAAGTVANVSQTTDKVTIIVIKHPNDLLTVYANATGVKVKEGQSVTRGQTIAAIPGGNTNYVHFEVRKGFDSQDPVKYLN
ncbi:MAG: peptidoglycan DD-metalloendopeptidase family protein [Paracoccaceae bacterium]